MNDPFRLLRGPIALCMLSIFASGPNRNVWAQTAVQSPRSFLGYELGERFTPHHRVVAYFRNVAGESDRIHLQEYGRTNEDRILQVAFVSSPENIRRLPQIRHDNLRLAGLESGEPEGEPVSIVWLSYNVHGNESVSTEAAMATLYKLVDPGNTEPQEWLKNTVVVIDPAINPDGRDRYVNWYNRAVGSIRNVNPDAVEHHELWPGGRTNHYYFDLNRDWVWQTQVETSQRLALYEGWMPHVHVDFHEQGVNEPYYFAPAAEPFHRVITDWQREFQRTIGENNARYFDAEGWLYFTRQVFDLFYPGYGDTFPIYNGAVGMTYEQGGSGRAGLGILTAEGDTLSLSDRIAHHFTTGLSTVEMASGHHDRLLKEFAAFFDRAKHSPTGQYKTFVVKKKNGNAVGALRDHLHRLGIETGTVDGSVKLSGYSYREMKDTGFTVSPGDLVISAYQPRSTLLEVLFEPESELVDSVTYDITAWALPYVYDVEAYAVTKKMTIATDVSPVSGVDARVGSDANITSDVDVASDIASDPTAYAYLVRWTDRSSAAFLSDLLQRDVLVRYSERSFTSSGEPFAPGTLIVTRRGNEKKGADLARIVDTAAHRQGVEVTRIRSGLVEKGPDLGSADVHYIKPPTVLVLTGAPVSSSSVGQVWHFFDQQINYPITLARADYLSSVDLDDYTVIVLPGGSYGTIFAKEKLATLTSWIKRGGRLITLRGATSWLTGKEGFALKKKEAADPDEDKKKERTSSDLLKSYGDRERDGLTEAVSGAIYRVRVDNTHPLGFGFEATAFELKLTKGSPSYLAGRGVWNVGVIEDADPVSGQVGFKAAAKIGESLAFGVQRMGRGSVVYFTDDPLFRGFWYSGQLLFSNAVFLVGQR